MSNNSLDFPCFCLNSYPLIKELNQNPTTTVLEDDAAPLLDIYRFAGKNLKLARHYSYSMCV